MADRVVWWQHGIPADGWIDRCASVLPALAVGCSSQAPAAAQARLAPRRRPFVVAQAPSRAQASEHPVRRVLEW